MPVTHKQKAKQKKQKARERRLAKSRNLKQNRPAPQFILNVIDKGKIYHNIMRFRNQAEVDAHLAQTESLRQEGKEIAEGEIVDAVTGAIILKIPASPAKDFKGTIADSSVLTT